MPDNSVQPGLTLDHVTFWVADLDRSTLFYRDGLGFKPRYDEPEILTPDMGRLLGRDDEVKLRLRRLERDGFNLTLVQYASDEHTDPNARAPVSQPGAAALSFDVTDIEKSAAKVSEAGGAMHRQHNVADWRMIIFMDPDGYMIELNQHPEIVRRLDRSGP